MWLRGRKTGFKLELTKKKKKLELTVNEPVTFSWASVSPSVKDRDAGRDWGQEEKGTTEGKMGGWHHRLDGHEFE